ncbi:hypothetical protein V6N13_105195 [Hibiscus sabdariffa]|uniref:Uncharacterized protein n=1 Tax=Hibiscus sabdariffa TaxID=183260 RepID=A0ABR2BMR7_9ROSI
MDSQAKEDQVMHQMDKGKVTETSGSQSQMVKRVLKGKNEVCNPIASKRSKTVSNIVGDEDEISEATLPITISATSVKAKSQPRREP